MAYIKPSKPFYAHTVVPSSWKIGKSSIGMMRNTIELFLLTYGIWDEIPSTWLGSSEENYKKTANLQYPNWKLAVFCYLNELSLLIHHINRIAFEECLDVGDKIGLSKEKQKKNIK